MKNKIALFWVGINLFAGGCYQNHFYVQQEWIDGNYLASTQVRTPDPRQEHPPSGQQLLVNWSFPKSVFDQKLTLLVTVRFWDNTQRELSRQIVRKRGYEVFFFPSEGSGSHQKILTYLVQAVSANGNIVGCWEHQFWTPLIDVGTELSDHSVTHNF